MRYVLDTNTLSFLMRGDEAVTRRLSSKAALEARGVRIEDFEVAVAAHANALDAVLVTDNVAQMGRVQGLRVENGRER